MRICSQPIYLASLLCALVDAITFHFLCCAEQKKGTPEVTGKEMDLGAEKFRYLINSTDKRAAR